MGTDLYIFFLFWITFIGSTVGSFLNVLVYRLPRGMNIAFPASHCPNCQAPIRPWHNIPVLGWLILRGRCYDCHEPISVRYPIIEGITGLVWLFLAAVSFRWTNNSFALWFILSLAAGILFSIVWGMFLVSWEKRLIRQNPADLQGEKPEKDASQNRPKT